MKYEILQGGVLKRTVVISSEFLMKEEKWSNIFLLDGKGSGICHHRDILLMKGMEKVMDG